MKKLVMFLILFPLFAFADTAETILGDVYGSYLTSCQTKQLATTGDNRLTTALSEGRRYVVFCTDGAGAGAACKCLQGGAAVSVSGVTGVTLFSGEKVVMRISKTNTQLSCESFASTPYVYVCLLD